MSLVEKLCKNERMILVDISELEERELIDSMALAEAILNYTERKVLLALHLLRVAKSTPDVAAGVLIPGDIEDPKEVLEKLGFRVDEAGFIIEVPEDVELIEIWDSMWAVLIVLSY